MRRLITCFIIVTLFVCGCSSYKETSHFSQHNEKIIKTTDQLLQGTPYSTTVCILESENPGPAIMIVGGVHGNETAGFLAAQKFCEVSLKKGTLIIIPRANALAIEKNARTLSEIGDLNRAYPGRSDGTPAERIAFEIVQLMKKYNVAMVLDLHEGYAFNAQNSKSVGETILPGKDDKSILLAMEAVEFINSRITEPQKKFSVLANPIAGSTSYYANSGLNKVAFTIETSSKQPLDDRVNYSFQIASFLLATQGVL